MKLDKPHDKKKVLRELDHLTTPPRLEGAVKNARMNPKRKQKRERLTLAEFKKLLEPHIIRLVVQRYDA